MVIASNIRDFINTTPMGRVLTINDFDVQPQYQQALVKALNRMVTKGELAKISKGKYYKPKQTLFGSLKPASSEIVKDFLEKNGNIIGYITGTAAFASMGLTTQISSAIVVGSNKYRRPLTRGEYRISFLLQPNTITKDNIQLLRILDAIKLIRDIPATIPDESIVCLKRIIKDLDATQQTELMELSQGYTPYVRALLGAIYEEIGIDASSLKVGLSGVTYYKLPISESVLPNKSNWRII